MPKHQKLVRKVRRNIINISPKSMPKYKTLVQKVRRNIINISPKSTPKDASKHTNQNARKILAGRLKRYLINK